MKSLPIKTVQYRYLLERYAEYLQILGYAGKTTESLPVHVREFLHYMEARGITTLDEISAQMAEDFTRHISQRKSRRSSGALSSNSIRKIISSVRVFAKFLSSTGGQGQGAELYMEQRIAATSGERLILTVAEIKKLYEITFGGYAWNSTAMGQRDRVIIALYYGCGLRRNEGIEMNVEDIDLRAGRLLVSKGKGSRQRYVPVAERHMEDIKDYLREGRDWFAHNHHSNMEFRSRKGEPLPKKQSKEEAAFLLSHKGERLMQPEYRLRYLQQQAEIERPITLHGLRHSIATHLLESGMELEAIGRFLGHVSLASTQIYTHIINEWDRDEEEE